MKYRLTNNTINHLGKTLYQIEALKDFSDVKEGDLGGYVESERNLSQEGVCWVSDSARVSDSAWVSGSARVSDSAWVSGSARVSDSACVYDSAQVSGSAWVFDSAQVFGSAVVFGSAQAFESAQVSGSPRVKGFQSVQREFDCVSIAGFTHPITVFPIEVNVGCRTFDILDFDKEFTELPDYEVDSIKAVVMAVQANMYEKMARE